MRRAVIVLGLLGGACAVGCALIEGFDDLTPVSADSGADSTAADSTIDSIAEGGIDVGRDSVAMSDSGDAQDAADSLVVDSSSTDVADASDSDDAALSCTPASYFCTGKVLNHCSPDGKSSSIVDTCATPELCASSGSSGCVAPTCNAGQTQCSGKVAQTCNSGRTGWTSTSTCTIKCSAGACASVTQLVSNDYDNCALLSDGTVDCWGWNAFGEVDTSSAIYSVPTPIAGLVSPTQISMKNRAIAVRQADGTAKWWGQPFGFSVPTSPVSMTSFTNVTSVSVYGTLNACVGLADGTIDCWGDNSAGQLGDGTNTPRSSPELLSELSGFPTPVFGQDFGCTFNLSTGVLCWGANGANQIGDGTTTERDIPTQVRTSSGAVAFLGSGVATGDNGACAISSGAVYCWGSYANGGSTTATPITGLSSGAVQVALGASHACAVMTDGSIKCWGSNFYGQLGDGTTTDSSVPVTVSGLANAAHVTLGFMHSCALLTDGTVKCWGSGIYGQFGDGTRGPAAKRYTPGDVTWP